MTDVKRAISSDAQRVLVIEDDERIGHQLSSALSAHGYRASWSRTGASGLIQAHDDAPHVILLDLGLPDLDGIELAQRLRTEFPTVLLMILTARDDDLDIVIGLDAGADDYLTKPFSLSVLLARLRAHLRTRLPDDQGSAVLTVGPLEIDLAARQCRLSGVLLQLRPKEYDLLATLAAHTGKAVSRDELMARVWDENWFGPTKTLDVTMVALRRKLTDAAVPGAAPIISTLRGHGYRLEPAAGHLERPQERS